MASQPPMISDDLRRRADNFIDLMSLKGELGREPNERPVRRPEPADATTTTSDRATGGAAPSRRATARFCPRLQGFHRAIGGSAEPAWFNAPVPTFLPPEGEEGVRLLIVGLAPGLRGANRTGRPFTGDYAGDLLYRDADPFRPGARAVYLARPDDGLELAGTAITNAVRCVPPENKPTPAEITTCRHLPEFNARRLSQPARRAGARRHRAPVDVSALSANGSRPIRSSTARRTRLGQVTLFSSYHCSRYNTNTGVLTEEMFVGVFERIAEYIRAPD